MHRLFAVLLCIVLCGRSLWAQDMTAFPDSSEPAPVSLSFPKRTPSGVQQYWQLLTSNVAYQASSPFKTRISSATLIGGTTIMAAILQEDRKLNMRLRMAKEDSWLVHKGSPLVTTLGGLHGVLLVGGLGAYAGLTHNQKLSTTVMLASQSYITSGMWAFVFKTAFGRTRPNEYNHWTGPGRILRPQDRYLEDGCEFNSFPSGHTTTAFAIASVFARQYKEKPIVGFSAYTLATMVGLSRMTENRHWGSDIIAGGLLGYLCGTAVVKNYEKKTKQTNNDITYRHNKPSRLSLMPVYNVNGTSLLMNYAL